MIEIFEIDKQDVVGFEMTCEKCNRKFLKGQMFRDRITDDLKASKPLCKRCSKIYKQKKEELTQYY